MISRFSGSTPAPFRQVVYMGKELIVNYVAQANAAWHPSVVDEWSGRFGGIDAQSGGRQALVV